MTKKIKLTQLLIGISIWSAPVLFSGLYASPNQSPSTSAPESAPSMPSAPPDGTSSSAAGGEYSPEAREYHLKAAFLRYVIKFVEWPANTLPPGAINVCVLGLVPSFEALNSINNKIVNDRTITISKVLDVKEAKSRCQMLFVTKTEEDNLKEIINELKDLPVLNYGDMEHYAEKGADMNFYIANNRLAIMINPPAVERSKLKIDPRMLKLVTVIPPIDQKRPE